MIKNIYRFLRYCKIYGFNRTLIKSLGHLRISAPFWIYFSFPKYLRKGKKVGLIGCGHHAYSSLAYYITNQTNYKILWAYDIDEKASSSLCKNYGIKYNDLQNVLSHGIYPIESFKLNEKGVIFIDPNGVIQRLNNVNKKKRIHFGVNIFNCNLKPIKT